MFVEEYIVERAHRLLNYLRYVSIPCLPRPYDSLHDRANLVMSSDMTASSNKRPLIALLMPDSMTLARHSYFSSLICNTILWYGIL